MRVLTDDERRQLLDHYMAYEPTIKVNALTYYIHPLLTEEHIAFLALNTRAQTVNGAASFPRPLYDSINNGLAMAWFTMVGYDALELSVRQARVCVNLRELDL